MTQATSTLKKNAFNFLADNNFMVDRVGMIGIHKTIPAISFKVINTKNHPSARYNYVIQFSKGDLDLGVCVAR